MAYRVVQRGRVLWNLVIFRIFSFQVWFRYGECECVCVCMDAMMQSNMLVLLISVALIPVKSQAQCWGRGLIKSGSQASSQLTRPC